MLKKSEGKALASSNWLALAKTLPIPSKKSEKKLKREREASQAPETPEPGPSRLPSDEAGTPSHKDDDVAFLRKIVLGQIEYSSKQLTPGKYVSLDCEMVGVGINGSESSLARVSIVNYHGAVLIDEFVRQKERVVDYRTQWSGVREKDMLKAKPFKEVQKSVANILKDRILVAHAVHNDLKALLLSHPHILTRDTQSYAGKLRILNTKIPALRNLVKHHLGLTIQDGEHSSITDARSTMALYRLYKKDWEKTTKPLKRKRDAADTPETEDQRPSKHKKQRQFPGGGRKGVSSGLSTVTKRSGDQAKKKWWAENNARGSMSLKSG